MTTSTHKAEVVQLTEFHPIEGADRIMRADVFGGYPCVVLKNEAIPGSLWVYIPPDSVVKVTRPEFSFLNAPGNGVRTDNTVRIKTRKFRKQQSMGLLIPAPAGAKVGDDLAEQLEITHYEPPEKGSAYTAPTSRLEKIAAMIFRRSLRYGEKPPGMHVPYYDIEALRRYPQVFEGKDVVVTEKIHGSNVAYAWQFRGWWHRIFRPMREQHLRVRSRTVWKNPHQGWYHCTAVTEGIKELLKENPDFVLFGEVYGPGVQKGFNYGVEKPTFVGFDIWNHGTQSWLPTPLALEICKEFNVPHVPVLYTGKFDFEHITKLAEGKTVLGGDHVREGVVITLDDDTINPLVRNLKCVGMGYYEVG